jgi:subtilisin family serine protease
MWTMISRAALVVALGTTGLLATIGVTSAAAATSLGVEIDPGLETARHLSTPEELIPVLIVMDDQADVETLLPVAQRLGRAERREFALGELKHLAATTQGHLHGFLASAEQAGRASDIRSIWLANGIAARLTSATIDELLGFDEIRIVLWDPELPQSAIQDITEPMEPVPASSEDMQIWWQLDYVRAPEVWALGYQGEGSVVAIVDTGVDRNHTDLTTHIWNNTDEIPGNGIDDDQNGFIDDTWGWNFELNNNNPVPGASHGTGCAGIVAGDGTAGTNTGVAPRALLMALRFGSISQWVRCFEYATTNGADVISCSNSEKWHFPLKPNYDSWRATTDNLLLTGIFHANSIGNEGDNQNTDPIPFNIAAPGCCPSPWRHPQQVQAGVSGVVGCGAVDQANVIAPYSSVGPFAWEDIRVHWPEYPHTMRPEFQDYPWWGGLPGLLKPDVIAPGPNTRTTSVGSGYMTFSGTSAATPHVAGAMALIAQANPNLTPEQMSMILETTAFDLGPAGKDNVYGAGRLDCYAAVQAALALNMFGSVAGTVIDAAVEAPIEGVLVEVVGGTETTTTNPSGQYELSLPAETYTLRFTHPNYVEHQAEVIVTAAQITILDVALNPASAAIDDPAAAAPARFGLAQNQPNPFNPSTTIGFSLGEGGQVSLLVFDVSGRLVRTLANGPLAAGAHAVSWDGRDDHGQAAPSGIYLYRLTANGETTTRRMTMLK